MLVKFLKALRYRYQIKIGSFVSYEPEFKILNQIMPENKVALDIGANVGDYTRELSKYAAHVFGFEPIKRTFDYLVMNTSDLDNVTLFNVALSSQYGIHGMSVPKNFSFLGFKRKNFYQASIDVDGDYKVASINIDGLGIKNIGLIKIDVEGHEYEVIQGMKNILENQKPILIIEGDDKSVREMLENIGYESTYYQGSPNYLWCPN